MASGTIQKVMPTEYTDSTSTTAITSVSKVYTVSGNGYVIASCSVASDTTSDVGWSMAQIRRDTTTLAHSYGNIDQARAYPNGAGVCVAFNVTNGQTITLILQGNKGGSKTLYRTILAFGCTLTST